MQYVYKKIFILSLGGIHDGTYAASACPASSNYIMTASVGTSQNATNLFYFSNCTLDTFKSTLLTPDMK